MSEFVRSLHHLESSFERTNRRRPSLTVCRVPSLIRLRTCALLRPVLAKFCNRVCGSRQKDDTLFARSARFSEHLVIALGRAARPSIFASVLPVVTLLPIRNCQRQTFGSEVATTVKPIPPVIHFRSFGDAKSFASSSASNFVITLREASSCAPLRGVSASSRDGCPGTNAFLIPARRFHMSGA
jgi:hypothetical protein